MGGIDGMWLGQGHLHHVRAFTGKDQVGPTGLWRAVHTHVRVNPRGRRKHAYAR